MILNILPNGILRLGNINKSNNPKSWILRNQIIYIAK